MAKTAAHPLRGAIFPVKLAQNAATAYILSLLITIRRKLPSALEREVSTEYFSFTPILMNVVGPHRVGAYRFRLGLPAEKSYFELKDER
jgi:hypothetical protein